MNRSFLTLPNILIKKLATPVSLHPDVHRRLLEHGDASILTVIQSLVENVVRCCPVMLPFPNMNAAAAPFSSVGGILYNCLPPV